MTQPLESTTTDAGDAVQPQQQQPPPSTSTSSPSTSTVSTSSSSPVMVENVMTLLSSDTDGEMTMITTPSDTDDDDNHQQQQHHHHENDPLFQPQPVHTVSNTQATASSSAVRCGSSTNYSNYKMTANAAMQMIAQTWRELFTSGTSPTTGSTSTCTSTIDSKKSLTNMTMMIRIRDKLQYALSFYCQFIASPSNQDKILKVLQYTMYMCSIAITAAVTARRRQQQQQQQQHEHRKMYPIRPENNNSSTAITAQWLYKLYNELTWARYLLRICLQFPVALDAAIHQTWTRSAATVASTTTTTTGTNETEKTDATVTDNITPSDDRMKQQQRQQLYNICGRVLTYSMVLYYPTELMAYLLWMKPKPQQQPTLPVVPTTATPNNTLIRQLLLQRPNADPTASTTTLMYSSTCHHPNGHLLSYMYDFYTTKRDPAMSNSSLSLRSLLSKLRASILFVTEQLLPSTTTAETWSYLSCRCWLLYVVTELFQSYVQYKELISLQSQPKISTSTSTITKSDCGQQQKQQQQQIVLQSIRNILFFIPCTTWSMSKWDTNPIVSTFTVNTLLWLESIVSIYQAMIVQLNNTNNSTGNKNNSLPHEQV